MTEQINIGDVAPDFTLKDQHNEDFALADQKGKRVLLSFHPLAFTPVCAKQMKFLEENFEKFEELNTVPIGVSVDSQFAKHGWAKALKVKNLRMIADFWPHGGYAKELGIFLEDKGFSQRANIILDEDGKVIFIKIYPIKEVPDVNEIIEFLENN
jgi:peroxiredoxin